MLLGGILTDVLNWHWIFLVNVPVGIAVVGFTLWLIPAARVPTAAQRLDVWGAVTVTGALMIAVYAIVNGNEVGWPAARSACSPSPPHCSAPSSSSSHAFPRRSCRSASSATATSPSPTPSACSGRRRCSRGSSSPRSTSSSSSATARSRSASPSCRRTSSWAPSRSASRRGSSCATGSGFRSATGLGLAAIGLLLFARAPVDGSFGADVLLAMILLGIGAGMAFNPVLLAAMGDVPPEEAGLASGMVNTSFMMGGALGLAVLASLAAWRSDELLASGESTRGGAHRRLPRRVHARRAVRCDRSRRRGDAPRGPSRRKPPRTASRRKLTSTSERAPRTTPSRATGAARPPSTSRASAGRR